jgi:prepilin-type N-terminal cleavage/methylation domain-containing protein
MQSRTCQPSRGFSLVEVMLAVLIFSFITGAVLQFTSATKARTRKAAVQIELEQQGRMAVEILLDDIRHAGHYVFTNDGTLDSTSRQQSILEASNYRLAFQADVLPDLHSPLETMSSDTWRVGEAWHQFPNVFRVRLPNGDEPTTGMEYFTSVATLDSVPDYLKRTAEVIVYTMDANEDGVFDDQDKLQLDAGVTPNPSDGVLRRKVIGTEIDEGGVPRASTSVSTVARGVRVFFDADVDTYPNETLPQPLFVYHISESFGLFDFDGNLRLNTFIFGDCIALDDPGCRDGRLDANEIANLQTLTGAVPSDIIENYQLDARLASPDVITRIRARYPEMSAVDARQFIRDSISSVRVNLIVEEPNARPNTHDVRFSTDEVPYRYVQHDLTADVFLPNAHLLSLSQLFFAAQFISNQTSAGLPNSLGTNIYNQALCPPASSANKNCWPVR